MLYKSEDNDTICAESTPAGVGGISVIRVSGPRAIEITQQIAPFLPEKPESHKAYYGFLKDENKTDIDETLVSFFKEGKSFTGENVFEISCHGSPTIVKQILSSLIRAGARLAEKGEFTFRSFMSGKMDLVQAESVLSLIESQSELAKKQALRQLQGSLSKDIQKIESDLIWCMAHMEADIDFSTEGLQTLELSELDRRLLLVEEKLRQLSESYKQGKVIKDGYRIVLAGAPNVGKSSLLNLLVDEDRAIVTDIPGTTRDLVDGFFSVKGLKIHLIDTAGLRESTDLVEKKGIEKSRAAIEEADAVFFTFDANEGLSTEEKGILYSIPFNKLVVIANKSDKLKLKDPQKNLAEILSQAGFLQKIPNPNQFLMEKTLFLSALDKKSRNLVISFLEKELNIGKMEDHSFVSNVRHHEQLLSALEKVKSARDQVKEGLSPEFVAIDLKEAILATQKVLGKRFDDEIMDRVFKEFCIGK